jgi:hypothetical protein
VPKVKSGGSATPAPSASASPTTSAAATPMSTPKQSDTKLQSVTKENADLNLDKNTAASSGGSSPVVVNNSNVTNGAPKTGMTTKETMHQDDPTYRDSIMDSMSRTMG